MRRWKLATWRFLATFTREESGSPTAESLTRVGLARAGEAPGDGTGARFKLRRGARNRAGPGGEGGAQLSLPHVFGDPSSSIPA